MKIVFIRHGYSLANERRVLSGNLDVSLSPNGIEQLQNFKNNVKYPETDYYVTSNLVRTHETFNILFEGKTINKKDSRFAEIDFGDYEEKSFDDLDMDDYFARLYQNENLSNNELMSDFYDRIEKGLIDLVNELKENNLNSATVIAHSTVIRILIVKATSDDLETFKKTRPKNGLGYVFDIDVVDGKIVFNSCEEIG